MRHYSAYNIRTILILTLGSLTYGYAHSVMVNTLGQPGFLDYFDLATNPARAEEITGAINGIFSAGGTIGALTAGYMSDRYGRKITMNVAAVISVLGGVLLAGAVNTAMFLVGRIVSGWGVGMLVVLIPIFQAEVSPPSSRGLLVGQHGVWIVSANAAANWISVGTYYSSNLSFQWRFSMALQCVCPLALLCCSPWVPESPRWLLMQGRRAESWAIVSKLHIDTTIDSEKSSFAQQEFHQMATQVDMDSQAWATGGGMRQILTKPSYRKRMWMGFFTQYAAQATGSLVVYSYLVSMYKTLGLTGGMVLVLGAAYITVAAAANFVASLIMDRVGRVRLLLVGLIGCMVTLGLECAMEALYAGTTNRTGNSLGVLFIFTFICFYAGGIDATSFVYCAEIFPTHIRSQGMAVSMAGTFLPTIVFLGVGPTALATIKWRYYVMFICLTVVNTSVIWWCFPETKGLSLEEINGKFGDEVAIQFSESGGEKHRGDMVTTKLDTTGQGKVEVEELEHAVSHGPL
ncbi:general substrate transporter [Leucogyrophana mollusca]|uniref:General substrate transporter n=1 Tax=Leucogyrophana mollusca TaxID=85980 RepID=A0ACB8BTS3_9AGAM|nr:general substrate transporter [Leucogyrophana mollusca]